ncbi:MAG: zf-HC2 domain-containing protein [Kofleriaceae bacterium]
MTCDDVRPQLTAYLDGELEGDRGSAVRGHLRGCEACRTTANDEAALRDGLRALPTLDAPSGMWAKIQTQLANAEIADSEQPRWRRVLARWSPQHWVTPRLALASGAVAVIFCAWAWRAARRDHDLVPRSALVLPQLPQVPVPAPTPTLTTGDVATEIAALPKATSDSYAAAAAELEQLATQARTSWSALQQKQFDAKVAELQHDITTSGEGRPRQRAYRVLIRYLERATTRDEVAFADTRGTP